MKPMLEEWYPAFKAWIRQVYGDRWTDRAIDISHASALKKGFRAGWRASIRRAQERVLERSAAGDHGAKTIALRMKCPHCGRSPAEEG